MGGPGSGLPRGYKLVPEARTKQINVNVRDSWYREHFLPAINARGLKESDFLARAATAIVAILESNRISEKWKTRWIGPIRAEAKKGRGPLKENPLYVVPAVLGTPFKLYRMTGKKKGTGPPGKDHLGVMVEAKDRYKIKPNPHITEKAGD